MKTLGHRIKTLRNEKGMTQEKLGEILNVGKSTISQYENNVNTPDTQTLQKLADFFGCSLDYLLGRTDTRNPIDKSTDEVNDILETLHKRPEMKTLFSISKNATKEDIEKAMRIIEALKGD